MAEKRVSVRLAAVGGRQVRAELEGVGEAGSRGFGRLSREMEAANARLAAFSRRVQVAAAAAVTAATLAGVAMIRSGLQTVDAQAKLAQSLGTTVASIQTLERAGELAGVSMSGIEQATKDLTRRLSQAAAGTGPAADALDRLGLSANELIALPLDQRVGAINAAIESFVPAAERAAVAGQLFGEEGSIAMSRIDTATLRQATEDVLAFGVVVSEQDADQIERTNDAISRLGLIWRGLSNQLAVAAAPALEAVADAMAAVASRTGPLGIAIRGLFDNIGRLTTYAATFAAFLAGRWVAGMAAAALSVRGLATALVVLRGALIRTGIGALIVGAGELVYQFTRLVSGAGGFGEAMSLLKDLAVEVWERIRMGAAAAGAAATAMFFDLKADAASGMQSAIESVVGFGNTAANTFEGAYEAIKAIWGLLPAAIGDLAFQAANSLVDGVEAMLNGVVSRINGFIGGINQGLEALGSERRISLVPDLDLGEIENRFEGAASAATTAAQAAFDRAFEDNPLTAPDLGLTEAANRALESANLYRGAARDLAEGARAPLESWQALRDAVRGTDEAECRCADRGHRRGRAAGDGARRCRTRRDGCRCGGRGCCRCGGARDRGRRHRLAGGHGGAVGLRQQGPRDRRRHRPEPRRRLPVGRERRRRVREDRQAELPRSRHLAAGRSRQARGAAVHPRADRQCARPARSAARAASSPTSCTRAAWSDRPGPRGWSRRMAFAGASRMHAGGMGGPRHDEVPAILQRGERVLSRRETPSYGAGARVNVTIMARDAESFRQSRTQVAADIARAVSLGRRGM